MRDKQEVERGACSKCKCKEYHIPIEYNACDYCGCRPVDHEEISTTFSSDSSRTQETNQPLEQNQSTHETHSEEPPPPSTAEDQSANPTANNSAIPSTDNNDASTDEFLIVIAPKSEPPHSTDSNIYATVYMDLTVQEEVLGRLVIELFANVPRAAKNFYALCTGERMGLQYYGNFFHKIIGNEYCEAGDITIGNGKGGVSIYGPTFEDEKAGLEYKHTDPGVVCMASNGPNTNNSKFFITTTVNRRLNGKYVVVGKLKGRESMDVLQTLTLYGSQFGMPRAAVMINACGDLEQERLAEEAEYAEKMEIIYG